MTKHTNLPHSTWLRSLVRVTGRTVVPTSLPWLALLIALISCAAPPEPGVGTATVNLVGQAPSGTVYRLRHAAITVTAPGVSRTWNTEDDPSRTSLSDEVAVGEYAASLAPGWNLERIAGPLVTPVVARLLSDNPVSFVVSPEQRTIVPLRFHVDGDVVDMAQGYDLVLGIEESPPLRIIVTDNGDNDHIPSIRVYEGLASGDVAPLQAIAGPLTTLVDPLGITVTDEEIIVCDSLLRAIDVFSIHATGNVSPIRQIVGPDTGIDFCLDVAVDDGRIYVTQGFEILVFPLGADGNVPPTLRLPVRTAGQYLAIDHGELYESSAGFGFGEVVVYPLPLTENSELTRALSLPCTAGIAVANGELFVGDDCGAREGAIRAYPATAVGRGEPLRSLAGDATRLRAPAQIRQARGELYVAEPFEEAIFIFPDQASGSVAPVRAISGPNTGLASPIGIAVH